MNIHITGGAGFIGQHLTPSLLQNNVSLTILDNFLPQVHGDNDALPPDIAQNMRLVCGSVLQHTFASWRTMEFGS